MFTDELKFIVGGLPEVFALLVLTTVLFGLIWLRVNQRLNKYKTHVPVGVGSKADGSVRTVDESAPFAWNRLAVLAAFIIGIQPVLTRSFESNFWVEVVVRAVEAAWVLFALWAVKPVLDRAILPNTPNYDELVRGNKGLGVLHAGFYVGFGFILRGSLIGSAPSALTGFLATVVFAVLGTVVMVAAFFIYDRLTPWDNVHKDIAEGRFTSAIGAGGALASTGIITSVGVAGDFTTWPEALMAFAAMFLVGIAVQVVWSFVVDHVLMPNCSMRTIQEKNQPVEAGKLAGANVLFAFVLMQLLTSQL